MSDYPAPECCNSAKPGCSPVAFSVRYTHPDDWPSAEYTVCENHIADALVLIYRSVFSDVGAEVTRL